MRKVLLLSIAIIVVPSLYCVRNMPQERRVPPQAFAQRARTSKYKKEKQNTHQKRLKMTVPKHEKRPRPRHSINKLQ